MIQKNILLVGVLYKGKDESENHGGKIVTNLFLNLTWDNVSQKSLFVRKRAPFAKGLN